MCVANSSFRELEFLRNVLDEIGFKQPTSTVYEDNTGAIRMSQTAAHKRKMKHVPLKYYYVKERVAEGAGILAKVPTEECTADVLTKPLSKAMHEVFTAQLLGETASPQPPVEPFALP